MLFYFRTSPSGSPEEQSVLYTIICLILLLIYKFACREYLQKPVNVDLRKNPEHVQEHNYR